MPVRTFSAESGAELKQNKGNDEEWDGDEAESTVGPCAGEVCNHYDERDFVRSGEKKKKGEGKGEREATYF